MRRGRWRWGPILGVLLASCGGASPSAPREEGPYGLRIDARAAGSFDGRGQAAWISDMLAAELSRARHFRAGSEDPSLDARLYYAQQHADGDAPVLRVDLEVEPDADLVVDLDAIGMVLDARVELERRDHTVELRRDLPIAVERALALLDAKVTVARGTVDDIAVLLHDEDPEVILLALDGVERRRLRTLGDPVHTLLDHPDERVAMRAVECLGVIGGPEHIPGLLRAARLADRAHAHRLYEALANLGGAQARGFLAFAARNEEDPELASSAEQALARLDAAEPRPVRDPVARGHRQ